MARTVRPPFNIPSFVQCFDSAGQLVHSQDGKGYAPYAPRPKDDDPLGLRQRGYRFIVRGNDASWRKPCTLKPGDVDATDITDTDELAAIIERERITL